MDSGKIYTIEFRMEDISILSLDCQIFSNDENDF